jgi:chitinase
VAAQSFTPIRVNTGGNAYTDGASNVWSADTGYNTGSTASTGSAIAGTTDDALYQTNRWDAGGGSELEYTFTVPNGVYEVNLLFAAVRTT